MGPIVPNGKGIVGPARGDYKFCMSVVCISRVNVTRACGFGLLQQLLGLTPRGVSLGVLFVPLYELFEWV